MTKNKIYPNKLLVEGDQDKRVIPEFIEQNGIKWENNREPIVYIKSQGSKEALLDIDEIDTALQESGLKALGIVVDADEKPEDRKQRLNQICEYFQINLVDNLPKEGLIFQLQSGVNFGIWMMPDNKNAGMLETFLSYLISPNNPENDPLWLYTQEVVQEAKNKGANFKKVHQDKACIHTWLAWQDEPGQQLHQAIKYKILNPTHQKGQEFFNWFKKLYNL